MRFLQTAEDLGVALFVHPWDMDEGGRFSKYWHPWLVGESDRFMFGTTTLSIMTFSIVAFSITTLSIMTFSIMTLIIMTFRKTIK